MRQLRVLGFCGLSSAWLTFVAGQTENPAYLSVAGLIMVVGNLYALLSSRT
jgi:hypothetical protein